VTSAIEVDSLVKSYDGRVAVSGVTFEVAAGTVFAILGPNGAGKTTTVEILEGYRRPDRGSARVLGLDPVTDSARLRPRMGLMLQSGGIYPGAKAGEVVRLFCAHYNSDKTPDELLRIVGLEDAAGTTFRRLSGGEQRRLALAVALCGRPEVVFLDEPTAGMDPKARQLTYDTIRGLRAEGVTVVLTTHLLDEAENLADMVAIMDRGRLVVQGSPAQLMSGAEGIRFTTTAHVDLAALPASLQPAQEVRPGEYLCRVRPTPAAVADLAAWAAQRGKLLAEVRCGSRSLHDVFMEVVE
jgi:ABC-2 type transport system ATP-binding protein